MLFLPCVRKDSDSAVFHNEGEVCNAPFGQAFTRSEIVSTIVFHGYITGLIYGLDKEHRVVACRELG